MLAQERYKRILQLIAQKQTVTVQELTALLQTSESTVRRDLNDLHDKGLLVKVFGGATAAGAAYEMKDEPVRDREDQNREEKLRIAKYAVQLIQAEDFVYLDAGTTTGMMIDLIEQKDVIFVTNGMTHAQRLAQKGFCVHLPGGQLKQATDALVGGDALRALSYYNFTKGFFGVNGIHLSAAFSTPDINEAHIKEWAIRHCNECYILADTSKFNRICPVNFASLGDASIITTKLPDERYRNYSNIMEADSYDLHNHL